MAWTLPAKRAFRVVENEWIFMADGVRLSARLWIPRRAERNPAPAVLEYIPYRKSEAYRAHDDVWGATLAGFGIAYARVDVRGTGDSHGVVVDEYSPAELEDGCQIIAWLAAQKWCNGAVGMRGISWGGINTLQIAAMRPAALKAIMPMGCCDDRYTDDAHYIGGALAQANFQWGVQFKAVMAAPPDPRTVGVGWEEMWRARLQATPSILHVWTSHQRADGYWRRGSIATDYAAIACPVFIVAGWQDTYSNPVGRLLENLTAPRRALIGPWGHTYPWSATPLGLDWAHEEVRWWAHWLAGEDTGVMDEPMLRVFMPYAAPAESLPHEIPGRLVAEAVWPSTAIIPRVLHLNAGGLAPAAGHTALAECGGGVVVGLAKPEWLNQPAFEQSVDDARSLTFDSDPLAEDMEILGFPLARITFASDQPLATLAVRLSEVTSAGDAWLVTWGLRNLSHRHSHAEPQPLIPGETFDVQLPLAMVAHRFKRGSRIRVAISESLWPLVWPSPAAPRLTLALGAGCAITLPVRPAEAKAAALSIPENHTPPAPAGGRRRMPADADSEGRYRILIETSPRSQTIAATGVAVTRSSRQLSEIVEGEPLSSRWEHRVCVAWKRGDWDCAVEAACELTSTAEAFQLTETLVVRRDGEVIFEHRDAGEIARDLA